MPTSTIAALAEPRDDAIDLLAADDGVARVHVRNLRRAVVLRRSPGGQDGRAGLATCLAISAPDGLDRIGEDADRCLALFDYWLFSGSLLRSFTARMVALVISVEPNQREMSVRIPNDRLQP